MYKKILAAVNEYTNSEIAARYAIALAKSSRASISFVFVAENKLNKNAFKHAEAALNRLFIDAKEQDIEVESITEQGDPLKKIIEIVKKNNIDIVFAATRREDINKRFFVKTFARELIIKLPCSVAITKIVRMGKTHPRRILVPLRSHISKISERAFFVASLAQAFDASVTIFYAPKPIVRFFHGEVHIKASQREKDLPTDIETFTEYLNRYMIQHIKKTGHGKIARAITIEAAHRRNDLIVMGASERSLLRSMISGNPVEDILRETPCNLIILKPKHNHQ